SFFFFFQAEDGIRYFHVTGVQTCALPIYAGLAQGFGELRALETLARDVGAADRLRGFQQAQQLGALRVSVVLVTLAAALVRFAQIGRASCRERVEYWRVGV